ncbi:hypothetical protein [Desulfosporosinus shakirovi]|uniref:hypothetical protein n=1 Tax=Desulfosporosinus shakirovi TaxID=2885154 RepID=UPI001E5AC026|nr:hypothetical protein [Desulfosporosinus sp. SRJS8]MCB8816280.1 hypothetical protein [Desulfosporosinus sp. SRJS8]
MRRNIKNTFLVSALSLGLIVGAVGVAGAATSMDYQKNIAEWIKNDPNPVVMNSDHSAAPVNPPAVNPINTPVATPAAVTVTKPVSASIVTPASPPVTVPAKTVTSAPVTTGQPNQYHYSDGHSNMNPQQHQQLHYSSMNGNTHNTNHNQNHNSMSGNHMSGIGHE